jgi:hypothetical protein
MFVFRNRLDNVEKFILEHSPRAVEAQIQTYKMQQAAGLILKNFF